jgi:alkylation response protein AidB-like acyl-CoA dehydrogenase
VNFGLSEEQILLKDTIRRFLAEQCPTTRVRSIMESDDGHDRDLWRDLAGLGVQGLVVSERYGGAGQELLDLALAAEELGYAATPGPFLGTALATVALIASGNEQAQARWLPEIASGKVVATFALGEEDCEWDPGNVKTRATSAGLSGTKSLVPYAGVANLMVVAAMNGDGPGLWLVEGGTPGMTVTPRVGVDMTRRLDRVTLSDTPATPLASGRAAADRARDAGLVLLAADAYGGARRCLDMTIEYALTREQFGQVIGAFQAVKHQLADLATELEPALSLYWYAAHAFDRIQDQAERHASLAKGHVTDLYDRATRVATELHGGIGFSWEFDLHLWFRRAILDRGFLGEASYHRERAAALAGW